MSNTININELRELLQNAWAAGYIAASAGLTPVEATTTRTKYVEEHITPYVPAKVEETRKEPEFDLHEYLGISKEDVRKAMDDFFFSGLRDTCVKSGRAVPDWMHL